MHPALALGAGRDGGDTADLAAGAYGYFDAGAGRWMRVFRDEAGVEWMAWAVRPGGEPSARRDLVNASSAGSPERRVQADRRVAPAPEPIVERRRADRRGAPPDRMPADRIARTMPPALVQGWLAFQSGTARRRLAPIPDGWATRRDEELVQLCREARPVPPAVTPVSRPRDAAEAGADRSVARVRAEEPPSTGA